MEALLVGGEEPLFELSVFGEVGGVVAAGVHDAGGDVGGVGFADGLYFESAITEAAECACGLKVGDAGGTSDAGDAVVEFVGGGVGKDPDGVGASGEYLHRDGEGHGEVLR